MSLIDGKTNNTLNGAPLKPVTPHLSTRPAGEAASKGSQPSYAVVNTATATGGGGQPVKVTPGEPIEVPKNNWS